jgi:hypothetical protein
LERENEMLRRRATTSPKGAGEEEKWKRLYEEQLAQVEEKWKRLY